MKSLSFHPFRFLTSGLSCIEHTLHILHHISVLDFLTDLVHLRTTGCSLVKLLQPPEGNIGRCSSCHHRPSPLRPLHPALHRPLHRRPLHHHRPNHWPGLWPDVPASRGYCRALLQSPARPCHGSCLLWIGIWPVCAGTLDPPCNRTPWSHWNSLLSFSNCCCGRIFCPLIQVQQ